LTSDNYIYYTLSQLVLKYVVARNMLLKQPIAKEIRQLSESEGEAFGVRIYV